jgi:lantibiotic transport system permease protein
MNLLVSFRSEMLKTKRTASFYFTIIAAVLVPLILLADVSLDGMSPENRVDPFNAVTREGFGVLSVLIFPMFIMLVCTMLPQIEYRNNTWKQVFASPQSIADIFIARFLNVHFLIMLFLVLYNVCMFMTAVAIHLIDPSIHLLHHQLDWHAWMTQNVNVYLAILSISAIQFWLGLRFRNFIVPMAIGFAMWVIASMMVMELETPNAHYFPYTHLLFSTFPQFRDLVPAVQWISVGYLVLFLGIAFVDFRRKVR